MTEQPTEVPNQSDATDEPEAPGFYHYSSGLQVLMFLKTQQGKWYALYDNGSFTQCEWEYISQALNDSTTLVKVTS